MQTTNVTLSDWMLVDADSHGADMTATPETSPLLRLPPELLTKILELALGGHVLAFPRRRALEPQSQSSIHTSTMASQQQQRRPPSMQQTSALSSTPQTSLPAQTPAAPPPPPPPQHLLGILLTNRALHATALPTLYATNDFAIDTSALFNLPTDPQTTTTAPAASATHLPLIQALRLDTADLPSATALLARTPAPVRARLRRLTLSCCGQPGRRASAHLPHGSAWREVWAAIAALLPRLRRVDAWVCGHDVPAGWQRAVLGPVAEGCRGMGDGVRVCVWVAWGMESVEAQRARGWGFEIRRYGSDLGGGG